MAIGVGRSTDICAAPVTLSLFRNQPKSTPRLICPLLGRGWRANPRTTVVVERSATLDCGVIASIREPCDENVIHAGAASTPCARSSGKWVLAATILGSSMAFIDGTVVNVALPALQTGLNASLADVQWVIEAYLLLLAALLLVGGSLGDRYGRRRIFVIGVLIFSAASAGCGLARNIHQLLIARAVQGFGAAPLLPGSLALISM